MDSSKRPKKIRHDLPTQEFNGKVYYLYKGEKYFSKGRKRLHRVVWEYYNGEIPKDYDVHHVDGNTHNNSINNLNLVNRFLHAKFTGKQRFKNNPNFAKEFHEKGIEAAKKWHKSKEGKEWHSKHGKQTWVNREYRKLNCQVCGKEYETRHSGVSKYCHQNCKAKALRDRRKGKLAGL